MKQDVERLLKQKEKDRIFVELEMNRTQDEEDKWVEDHVNVMEEIEDDEDKEWEMKWLWAEYVVK